MTPEQIETLRKMLDECEQAIVFCESQVTLLFKFGLGLNSKVWSNRADEAKANAAALRAAIALAEEARAMEGWDAVTYLRGNTIATRQGDGQWYIEDETRFQYLSHGGIWSGFESREAFADAESAIAAANRAMKAGE